MISWMIVAAGLLAGYTLTVAMFMVTTFGVASASPNFAVKDYRVRSGYKLLQDVIWLICTFLGSVAAAFVVREVYTVEVAIALGALLIAILWVNTWEARQRGLPHQILMSAMTGVGVTAGFVLVYELTKAPGS